MRVLLLIRKTLIYSIFKYYLLIWLILLSSSKFRGKACIIRTTGAWLGGLLDKSKVDILMDWYLVVWKMDHSPYGTQRKWLARIKTFNRPILINKTHFYMLNKVKKKDILLYVLSGTLLKIISWRSAPHHCLS